MLLSLGNSEGELQLLKGSDTTQHPEPHAHTPLRAASTSSRSSQRNEAEGVKESDAPHGSGYPHAPASLSAASTSSSRNSEKSRPAAFSRVAISFTVLAYWMLSVRERKKKSKWLHCWRFFAASWGVLCASP